MLSGIWPDHTGSCYTRLIQREEYKTDSIDSTFILKKKLEVRQDDVDFVNSKPVSGTSDHAYTLRCFIYK